MTVIKVKDFSLLSSPIHRTCFLSFWGISLGIATLFFLSQLLEAYRWPMWGDETHALDSTIRLHSYLSLLLEGAKGQVSPSPLDYLMVKFLDQVREVTGGYCG